jgi:hypothetical protein
MYPASFNFPTNPPLDALEHSQAITLTTDIKQKSNNTVNQMISLQYRDTRSREQIFEDFKNMSGDQVGVMLLAMACWNLEIDGIGAFKLT